MIKLILSDIDGTVLPEGQTQVSEATIQAFHAALDAGIHIGPASGRSPFWVRPFFHNDEALTKTCIASNGLEIYLDGQCIRQDLISKAAVQKLASVLNEKYQAGILYFEGKQPHLLSGDKKILQNIFPDYARRLLEDDDINLESMPDGVGKLNVFVDASYEKSHEICAELNSLVEELDFDVAFAGYFNVMVHGRNKGTALLSLCEALNISTDEVVVFGDADNDIQMFKQVKHSVAMANGTDLAKAEARWQIGSVDEDAVAKTILKIVEGTFPLKV